MDHSSEVGLSQTPEEIESLAMREIITLACNSCRQRNYSTMKNKRTTPDRLERKKYCRFCRKHTVHRETR
jgi:large subunit ribosomal protein L33